MSDTALPFRAQPVRACATEDFRAPGWWDPAERAYASLRAVGEFNLALLLEWVGGTWCGRSVVDLGCGGGLLGVPLARAGAVVVGVDLSVPALREAKAQGGGRFTAIAGDFLRAPVGDGVADLVLLADVLEHVDAPAAAVAEAARVCRPGGLVFVHTINRTLRARLLAVTLGEGLGLIPRGTHDPRLFVRPRELDRMAAAAGLAALRRTGESARLWRSLRTRAVVPVRTRSLAVSYVAMYRRAGG